MKTGTSRNTMRLRNLYLNAITRFVEKQYQKSWSAICKTILEANNDLLGVSHIAFNHLGESYPEDVARNTKKALLNRKSSPLHEDFQEEFEELHNKYVKEWNEVYRSFRNLVTAAFRDAKNEEEMEQVLPVTIVNQLEAYDFHPLPSAEGLSPERVQELKARYGKAYEIDGFITLGNLI